MLGADPGFVPSCGALLRVWTIWIIAWLTAADTLVKKLVLTLAESCLVVQMPKGVPVATVAIGNAANAGLLALRILAGSNSALQQKMLQYQVRP